MSVDDVIARHRARLDEHRRFLENSTSTELPVSTGMMGAPPESDNRKSQSRSEMENADFSPQPLKPQEEIREPRGVVYSPYVNSGAEMQRCQSAHNVTEEQRIQRRRDVYINQSFALQEANFPHGKRFTAKQKQKQHEKEKVKDDVEMSGDLCMAGDNNNNNNNNNNNGCASRAASTSLSFFAGIDRHEQLAEAEKQFEAQLRSAARYYIRRPDDIYIKSQRWLESRERSRRQLQHEQALKALDECSFRPNRHHSCNNNNNNNQPHHHHQQQQHQQREEGKGENTPTAVVSSSYTQKSTNAYKLHPPPPPIYSSSPSGFITVRDEAGVAAHLERLREARRRRSFAARRLRGGTAGTWNNRATVPIAFVLGRRVANIPALRRPYTVAVPHNTTEEEDNNDNDNDNNNAEKTGATTTTTTNVTVAGVEEEKEEVEEMEDDDMNRRDTVHARRRATAAVGKTVSRLEKTIALLKNEIAEKDRMLLQQKSEILLLKRDLEVAKITVRRLSLQDVAQSEWTDEVTPVRETSVSDG